MQSPATSLGLLTRPFWMSAVLLLASVGLFNAEAHADDHPNEPPVITGPSDITFISLSTEPVARYTAVDPEGDPITWSLDDEADEHLFTIDQRGVLRFKTPPDYSDPQDGIDLCTTPGGAGECRNNAYYVGVFAKSPVPPDDKYEPNPSEDVIAVRIVVSMANEGPQFQGSSERQVDENVPPRTKIGDHFHAFDSEQDTILYHIQGADSRHFTMDSLTGQLRTKDPLDYEARDRYSLQVIAKDPAGR